MEAAKTTHPKETHTARAVPVAAGTLVLVGGMATAAAVVVAGAEGRALAAGEVSGAAATRTLVRI